MTVVLRTDQPSRAIVQRELVLILAVVTNPAAIKFPVTHIVAQPTELPLVEEATLLNVSGAIEQIVVRCEVEVDRCRNINAAPGVAANIGEQQASLTAGIDGKANPGQVQHRHIRYLELGAPGLRVAAFWIDLQRVGVQDPVRVIGAAIGHAAVIDRDFSATRALELIRSADHSPVVNHVTRVGHDRFFGLAVVVDTRATNQYAGLPKYNITGSGRRFAGPVCGHLISGDLTITLLQRDIALE